MSKTPSLSEADLEIMRGYQRIVEKGEHKNSPFVKMSSGWFFEGDFCGVTYLGITDVNKSLNKLVSFGYFDRTSFFSGSCYRITPAGKMLLAGALTIRNEAAVEAVDPLSATQINQVKKILTEILDVSENIRNNREKHQVIGLVRAIEILISIPDPPRNALLHLIRDPAFAGIIQTAALLAAIATLVKP